MATYSIFPFLPNNNTSIISPSFPYDVVINTAYPGVQFIGTEPNALYQEIREVSGCLWFVTNAMYNENLLQWDQETNQNTGLPAYALELCDGAMTRWYSPPTNIPMTPITWIALWTITADGLMDSTPLEVTGVSAPMNSLMATWDPGIGIAITAREVDITNTASAPTSLLDNLVVNGTQVWTVDITGTLTHGIIPAARITGLVPFPGFNNVTLTGTTIMTGPVIMDSTLLVQGDATFDMDITGNSTLSIAGISLLAGGAVVDAGLTVTGGETTDNLNVTGTSILAVTDATTLGVSGITLLHNVQIATGDTITINGATPVVGLESLNGSITIAQVTPTEYNIQISNTALVPIGSVHQIAMASTVGAVGGGNGPGTLSLLLPGTAANGWAVTVECTIGIGGAGSFSMTDSGGSFTGVPITWSVGNFASYVIMYDYGTAVGGDTITSSNSPGYSEFYRIQAVRTS